jgi:FdhD protein
MQQMRQQQKLFAATAATHAVALYDISTKKIIDIAEDVGRHNAADKVIGQQLLLGNYPISQPLVLLLSGRVSFDMIQKTARANISAICAVGMPTSLAIESAQAVGIKLYAWAREDSVCLY